MSPTLSPVQAKVMAYLQACGHATASSVARHLYGTDRQASRAMGVLYTLSRKGLVRPEQHGQVVRWVPAEQIAEGTPPEAERKEG